MSHIQRQDGSLQLKVDSIVRLMGDIRISQDMGEENTRELRSRDGGFAFCRVRPHRNVHGDRKAIMVMLQDTAEMRYRHKNGSILWMLAHCQVIEWNQDWRAKNLPPQEVP